MTEDQRRDTTREGIVKGRQMVRHGPRGTISTFQVEGSKMTPSSTQGLSSSLFNRVPTRKGITDPTLVLIEKNWVTEGMVILTTLETRWNTQWSYA